MVHFENVTKTFRNGAEKFDALKNVNLEIAEGEFVIITGESGSGKTTLLNLIGGLDLPTSGEVTVNGLSLRSASDRRLSDFRNASIGFIFQSYHLQPSQSVLDNVIAPLLFANTRTSRPERRQIAEEKLERVGLSDKTTQRAGKLSSGQKQRAIIARALVNNPTIILADEPTANLDEENSTQVIDLLKSVNTVDGAIVVLVTHETAVLEASARFIRISQGRIVS